MEYIAEICNVSPLFLSTYSHTLFPEIERKKDRPYSCLLLDCFDDFFTCIPFRSDIRHEYAYMFKTSVRSKNVPSGLDYSKSILVKNPDYIIEGAAVVDKDEFNEAMVNMPRITSEVVKYISEYRLHVTGTEFLHPREFQRRYRFSTLPYFHDVLGI